jgi:hypothetical protein
MLAESSLLAKLEELKGCSLIERMRACGYVRLNSNTNKEELDIDGFYGAIVTASGIKSIDDRDEISLSPELEDGELYFIYQAAWFDLDLSEIDDFDCITPSYPNKPLAQLIKSIEENNLSIIAEMLQSHLKASFPGECPPEYSFCGTIAKSHGPSLIYNYQNHKLPFFSTLKANFLMKAKASTLLAWITRYEAYRSITEGSTMRCYGNFSPKRQELEEVFFNTFFFENINPTGLNPDDASFFVFDSEYISEYYMGHSGAVSLKSVISALNHRPCVNEFQLQSSTLTWTETEDMKSKCDTDEIYDSFIVHRNQSIDPETLLSFASFADPLTRRSIAFHPDTSMATLNMLANDESDNVKSAVRERQLPPEWHYLHTDDMDYDLLLDQKIAANVLDIFSESDNRWIRRTVASNENTSSSSLSLLGADLCEIVRSSVAKNKSTPHLVLESLCTDPNPDVKKNALQTLNSLAL